MQSLLWKPAAASSARFEALTVLCCSAGSNRTVVLRRAARPPRAARLLYLLLLARAAATLDLQEQVLVNQRLQLLSRSQDALKQTITQDPRELEEERYGRLHAKHPVRHCCVGEACAAASTRVAFVASLRRCSWARYFVRALYSSYAVPHALQAKA